MTSVLDLSSSPLVAEGTVHTTAVRGHKVDPLDLALARARETAADRTGRPAGFAVRLGADGTAEVEVGDIPSFERLSRILATARLGSFEPGTEQVLESAPAVPSRAVLECFYGEQWTVEARASVVAEAAAHGANQYVYGPSADTRTGGRWRDLYEGEPQSALEALVAQTRELGMSATWRVSPGAPIDPHESIRLSEPAERSALDRKIDQVLTIGFDSVLIAFDDISAGLDPETAQNYAGQSNPLARAHADAINNIARRIGAERVIACPTHYWGAGKSDYRREFGARLDPGIPVCWTGPSVISDAITAAEAQEAAAESGHPIWLWDNFPVNDWDLEGLGADPLSAVRGYDNIVSPRRLPLAALTGREGGLGSVVAAYGANAAIGALTGLPALATALDFAWLGDRYDADRAWSAALDASGVDAASLGLVADAAGPLSGGLNRRPSRLAVACARVMSADEGELERALADLELVVANHREALANIRSRPSPLVVELQPWLSELARQLSLATLAIEAIRDSGSPGSTVSRELTGLLRSVSRVSMASGAARALGEYARGLTGGGTPELPY